MLSDREILLTARAMVDRYGEEADIQAAMRADDSMAKGDPDGRRAWLRIVEAIWSLQDNQSDDAA